MKTNILPEYGEGIAQSVSFIYVDGTKQRSVPSYNFLDEYSQREWVKGFGMFAKHRGMTKENLSRQIRPIMKNRANEVRRERLRIRRDCQQSGRYVPAHVSVIDRMRDANLTPDVFKYERAIGIEIECLKPALRGAMQIPFWAREKGDGSIRTMPNTVPVEYAILLKRSDLEMRLHRFCNIIMDHKVNTSCGLHVHIDCRGRVEGDVRATAKRMTAWLIALKEFVPESRRNNNDYCALSFSETNRYRAVNFTAFRKFRTLEIRLHSGTVDYTKIIAWIRLLELLFVLHGKPKGGAQGIAALSQLPLTEYERSYWTKRHQQLNPGQYSSPPPSDETE